MCCRVPGWLVLGVMVGLCDFQGLKFRHYIHELADESCWLHNALLACKSHVSESSGDL